MPNIASVLKSEITRLARKEVRENGEVHRKVVSAHRNEIASLKKRVSELESIVKRIAKGAGVGAKAAKQRDSDASRKPSATANRFSAKAMAANRQRLGISAADFGLLVGATGQSVYAWEAGKSKPRTAALLAISALRAVGKREVEAKLKNLRGL